ncbi:GMP synthase domain protein [Eremococcus coleocola ACS-139-V-Col8]|uniref:GMP synthase (glutamine-hydrolyzing) n=1 Tax=Eremococcus coleocola ACS-139-V-Col8 TaxID=908337 RepID=E4KPL4_9LACT|nr:GMP synthase domain protein [Eremococcus coleocola ACS-139-V-Col8]
MHVSASRDLDLDIGRRCPSFVCIAGLAIRVMGEITKEKLDILRDADKIFREELEKSEIAKEVNQYFAVLTNNRTVGVMGDFRTYDYTLSLRAVSTTDFMTADFSRIPWDILDKVSNRIVNEVDHINRIVYNITSKPPATIVTNYREGLFKKELEDWIYLVQAP